MRTAALTLLCFVAFGNAMNAQRFSLVPQVGFENSKTKISFNDLGSFAPAGVKFTPQASLRLNYSSKQGHGFFIGAATSRSIVSFNFSDPENGMSSFNTTTGNMQLRLESGYQFNSKRISLNKAKSASKTGCTYSSSQKSGCSRSYSYSRCSGNKSRPSSLAKNGSWVRIQPSIGLGFIPVVKNDVVTKTQAGLTSYEYRAGNWQTGLIAGTSFELGSGNTPKVTVSVNYFKGLSNLGTETITTSDAGKTVNTTLHSSVSGWNLRVGIPFSLVKNTSAKNKTGKKTDHKSQCGYRMIRYRCGQ